MTETLAIIPCYRVKDKVQHVLEALGSTMPIICVDDACPEASGQFIESLGLPNVTVLYHENNLGVGRSIILVTPGTNLLSRETSLVGIRLSTV